jgi:hypothetical protein
LYCIRIETKLHWHFSYKVQKQFTAQRHKLILEQVYDIAGEITVLESEINAVVSTLHTLMPAFLTISKTHPIS